MSEPTASVPTPSASDSKQEVSVRPSDWVIPPTQGEVITSIATGNSYTMGTKIGEGHFGMVYSCVDSWSNDLAAKVMKPLGPYEKVKASTEAELHKLLQLRHPHITYVFDAFEFRDTFYIITERCSCPLTGLFSIENFSGVLWIRPIARCLLQAVQYIHNNQYVHQDIHLGNVFAAFARNEMNSDELGRFILSLATLVSRKSSTRLMQQIPGPCGCFRRRCWTLRNSGRWITGLIFITARYCSCTSCTEVSYALVPKRSRAEDPANWHCSFHLPSTLR